MQFVDNFVMPESFKRTYFNVSPRAQVLMVIFLSQVQNFGGYEFEGFFSEYAYILQKADNDEFRSFFKAGCKELHELYVKINFEKDFKLFDYCVTDNEKVNFRFNYQIEQYLNSIGETIKAVYK